MVQDNNLSTWNAYKNQYWPADYFIDAHGDVRHTQFGEGDYKQDEAVVRQLLYDAGARQLPPPMTASAIIPSSNLGTAETYLNPQRAQGFASPLITGHPLLLARPLKLAAAERVLTRRLLERRLGVDHPSRRGGVDRGRVSRPSTSISL